MARADDTWPLVRATLRSAVFEEVGVGAALVHAIARVVPLVVIFYWLIQIIRGHRATFMYTYLAGGKYHVGYTHCFSRREGSELPRLFGKSAGETIYVRYHPQNPSISVAQPRDNP